MALYEYLNREIFVMNQYVAIVQGVLVKDGGRGRDNVYRMFRVKKLENYDKVQSSASLLTNSNISCLSEKCIFALSKIIPIHTMFSVVQPHFVCKCNQL